MPILKLVSQFSRSLQKQFPQRPIKGISRLSHFLTKHLPAYQGDVEMNAGFKMRLASQRDAELSLMFLGSYQPALSYLLSQNALRGGYYLDVGANLGYFSLLFASWAGKNGKVAAFEANPQMAVRIREGRELNDFQIELVEKAVHDKTGETISFFVSSNPGKSSIYAENVTHLQSQFEVKTIRIDDYLEEAGWPRVDVIKMDIEGNDCRGLLGAEKTIRQYRPLIVFEFSQDNDKEAQESLAKLLEETDYTLEILYLNGKRSLFNWAVPENLHHVDVVCFPPKGK
jgi:FkbM family methyltransferase